MNKEELLNAIKVVKENSKKRKFIQSLDLIINLKNINLKKEKVQSYINLPFAVRKSKVGAFVDSELKKEADSCCDLVITKEEFGKYKDKKLKKKVVGGIDFFVAQANLMGLVASNFGKVLGPKGKMPDPKVGAVIPPGGNIKSAVEGLKKTIKIEAKGGNMVKVLVGREDMDENNVVSNILSVYDNLIHVLPNEKDNVKNVILKLSMGVPVRLGEKSEDVKNRIKVEEERRLKLKDVRRKEAEKIRARVKKVKVVKEESKEDKKSVKKDTKVKKIKNEQTKSTRIGKEEEGTN